MDVVDRIQAGGRDSAGAGVGRADDAVTGTRRRPYAKKGATGAPFFGGRGRLTASCRPSSSRPWLLSLPLRLSPPSLWDSESRGALYRSQRRCRLARRPALCGARRFVAETPARSRGRSASKKLGVSALDTPSRQAEATSASSRRLFLSALCSLLRHDSSLEFGSSAIYRRPTVTTGGLSGSTLIQDVDYG